MDRPRETAPKAFMLLREAAQVLGGDLAQCSDGFLARLSTPSDVQKYTQSWDAVSDSQDA